MQMRFGYTADTSEIATRCICRVTGGMYSHVFPVFYGGGQPIYFESIFKRCESIDEKDNRIMKSGVRGPLALSGVREWRDEEPRTRRFRLQPEYGYLPFTEEECDMSFKILAAAVHSVTYAPTQILRVWLKQRLHMNLYSGNGSKEDDDWTCSETCARATPPSLQHYFDLGTFTFDMITPSGDRLMSVERATNEMIADIGVRAE